MDRRSALRLAVLTAAETISAAAADRKKPPAPSTRDIRYQAWSGPGDGFAATEAIASWTVAGRDGVGQHHGVVRHGPLGGGRHLHRPHLRSRTVRCGRLHRDRHVRRRGRSRSGQLAAAGHPVAPGRHIADAERAFLNEAELFIAAGIPLVFSLSSKKNQIPGLTYSTGGHLLVVVGFTATGQPVLNDPASADNASVRKTVGRHEFEEAWLDSSGGVVYVIHSASVPLPAAPAQANW